MVEVVNHALHEQNLLGILLPEVSVHLVRACGGAHNIEELVHDGEHAVEVAGAGDSLKFIAQFAAGNANKRLAFGIHFIHGGREDNINARIGGDLRIRFQGARVFVIVFVGAELKRVNKDRRHHNIVLFTCAAQKRGVPCMQSTHRRYIPERSATVLHLAFLFGGFGTGALIQPFLGGGKRLRNSGAKLGNSRDDAGHRGLSHDENSLSSGIAPD